MHTNKTLLPQFVLAATLALSVGIAGRVTAQQRDSQQPPPPAAQPATAPAPALRLEDLEQMALKNNPTLAQARAAVRAAEGRRRQAGLWPNPIVGYDGEGLAFNPDVRANRIGHYVFFEQNILLGGKLSKSKNVAAQEKAEAEAEAEAQRLRVVNAVRLLYYEALGAQQMVDLRRQLADLTREAAGISGQLFNVGQSDQPDVLAAEVEQQRAEIDLARAQNDFNRVWQLLASVAGDPQLAMMPKATRLEGNLEAEAPKLAQEELLATLLRDSPEVKRALAGVERAKASISRAKAEPRPDLFLRGQVGNNNEFEEFSGFRVGWETRVEAGVRIPLFNRNQGSVAAAKAELTSAEAEVQRVDLALRARLAESFSRYLTSLGTTSRYQREVLPRAQRSYELYLAKFRQMGAAYPQVLLAQRTLFQLRAEYVSSLVELWQNVTELRGMLLAGGLDAPGGMAGAMSGQPGSK
jgi:cobalt-zinc-cadmium efflux system outer membrane protein